MTSHVYIKQTGGITREQWEAFCAEHEIERLPTAGGNIYFYGGRAGIEIQFGIGRTGKDSDKAEPPNVAEHVQLSTYWGGPRKRDLARIGAALWIRFGGSMYADEATRKLICEGDRVPA